MYLKYTSTLNKSVFLLCCELLVEKLKYYNNWKKKVRKEIHAILTKILGEHETSYAIVKNWVAQFKSGDFSTCDAPRPGRPKTVTTPEIIDQIHEIILEDRRISAKPIAEQLGISHERVGSIILEDLDMRKLSAKWVPKCPNADQKRQRCQSSEQLLECFRRHPNDFLSGAIGDNGRNLVISSLWPGHKAAVSGVATYRLTPPQKIPKAKISWKSSRLDFLGSRRHPPHWLSSKRPKYHYGVLLISAGSIKGHFERKTPREVTKGVLFLHDNASAHRPLATQKKLAYLGFQYLDHPTYSPHLAPPEYHLFPGLKKQLKGRHFSSDAKVIAAAENCLDGQISNFFLSGLQKLEQGAKKCIELRGNMLNKSRVWSL